jgi:hypothetical protein
MSMLISCGYPTVSSGFMIINRGNIQAERITERAVGMAVPAALQLGFKAAIARTPKQEHEGAAEYCGEQSLKKIRSLHDLGWPCHPARRQIPSPRLEQFFQCKQNFNLKRQR